MKLSDTQEDLLLTLYFMEEQGIHDLDHLTKTRTLESLRKKVEL